MGEPRDGTIIAEANGIKVRLNPNPDLKDLPDDQCWQMLMPNGVKWCGNKGTVLLLMGDEDMFPWRRRYGGCTT